MKQSILNPLFLLFGICLSFSIASAQTASTCTLKGAIKDYHNAYVPNVEITFSNKDVVRKVTTSENGEYSIMLTPGIYSAKVGGSKGFETSYRSEIKLDPGSSKTLNFKIYTKIDGTWVWSGAFRKGADHPSVVDVNFTYEEIPHLSENGVRSGMVRFAEKCQTQTLVSYNARYVLLSDMRNVTFTYDFLTVIADFLYINTKTKEIFAGGNLEIEKDAEYLKYNGVIKINVKDGKGTYEKVDTSEMY
jgi:hypothetical protein